jgi:hypothetical protein
MNEYSILSSISHSQVGQLLEEQSPRGLMAIFDRFRDILHAGNIDQRVQYTVSYVPQRQIASPHPRP